MIIRVGLKAGNLETLQHKVLRISSPQVVTVKTRINAHQLPAQSEIVVGVLNDQLTIMGNPSGASVCFSAANDGALIVSSDATEHSCQKPRTSYRGTLELTAHGNGITAVLITDLETYVQGVLQSEIPSYFKLEAMKAQAVLARTYGMRPRLSHAHDGFTVCDSFLHCQAFYGLKLLDPMQRQAIESTRNEVLFYDEKPALALFSACAGGHTESYEYCFSDPETGAFPPAPIPYLRGVSEGKLPVGYPDEQALRKLFSEASPQTDDSWSMNAFRWKVVFSADALEAHMHHIVQKLQEDPQFSSFIKAPSSGQFGHIKRFAVGPRGVAGTAREITIDTSSGSWTIEKELTIRNCFANPDLKLKRLKSARVFVDQSYDRLGLLSSLTICGFGSGHGVGLQQVGAHGLAMRGLSYRQIIEHYYAGTIIAKV